jgi:hypothetical protein
MNTGKQWQAIYQTKTYVQNTSSTRLSLNSRRARTTVASAGAATENSARSILPATLSIYKILSSEIHNQSMGNALNGTIRLK